MTKILEIAKAFWKAILHICALEFKEKYKNNEWIDSKYWRNKDSKEKVLVNILELKKKITQKIHWVSLVTDWSLQKKSSVNLKVG